MYHACVSVPSNQVFIQVPVCVCVGGEAVLVGGGGVLSVNPGRVIVKRSILSGHPYKINKRSAVIRYMFFDRG